MILGDSLLVMTSLVEKEGLKGKVQTIYIDPPYGIKFGSNWQVSTRKRDVKDGRAEDAKERIERAEMSEARANRIEKELPAVEKAVAALEPEEAAIREQMLVP